MMMYDDNVCSLENDEHSLRFTFDRSIIIEGIP